MSRPAFIGGGLSAEDQARIHQLAARGWSPHRIGVTIAKSPSTVNSYMLREGFVRPTRCNLPPVYQRGGTIVRQFTPAEDDRLYALRCEGMPLRVIGRTLEAEFGHPRTGNTVKHRLQLLAARDEAEETV